ncbi:helicase RepA family protein [Burkholderiaceae bacterium DAT-1]|nr:helicase RepA family protein [Burkholderiaceae bacterium DAT-1]
MTNEDMEYRRWLGKRLERMARNHQYEAGVGMTGRKYCHFELMTATDLMEMPSLAWVVQGILPKTGLAAIFGPPGVGKSFLTLDLLAAVADGAPWFSYPTVRAPVIYVALEGVAGLQKRLNAYCIQHGAVSGSNLRFITDSFNLLSGDDPDRLIETLKAHGAEGAVVALDTLNRAMTGADENNGVDMSRAIAAASKIQREVGGLVLFIHHAGKNSAAGLRGHSSLSGALDVVIELSRDREARTWKLAKCKDGEDGLTHSFALKAIQYQHTDGIQTIESCVVTPLIESNVCRREGPLGAAAMIALETLAELEVESGVDLREVFDIHCRDGGVVLGVLEKSWREKTYAAAIFMAMPTGDARRMAFRRAKDALVHAGILAAQGDYVWRISGALSRGVA